MGRANYTDKPEAGVLVRDEGVQPPVEALAERKTEVSHWPLSFCQQRLWFLEQLNPANAAYNLPLVARMRGAFDPLAFERALNAVIARHESLRTRFVNVNGKPAQIIDKEAGVKFDVEQLSAGTLSEREVALKRRIHSEVNRPFNLKEQVIRILLLRLAEDEHVLVLTMHHIVSDEWSLNILFRELGMFYEGFATAEKVELAELPVQYADYSVWQHEWLRDEVLEEQLSFWKQQLKGSPPALELATDFPRHRKGHSSAGGTVRRFLSTELEASLRSLAKREEATLFMVLLAAFKTLLYRYTEQEDVIVSSPMAGRNRLELEGLIGFFVNILPLRTDFSGNPTFKELLHQVRSVTLAACSHQDAPFEKIVEVLHPERSISEVPFAQVVFMLQNRSFERMRWRTVPPGPGDRTKSVPAGASFLDIQLLEAETDTSKFELSVSVRETSLGLAVRAEFNSGLFSEERIERFLQHFKTLLQGVCANPDGRISELPILDDSERAQMLVEWNNNYSDFPRDKCIHELFEQQAERRPDGIAAVSGEQSLTYREVNVRANQLAHYLRQYHIEPNSPVGICIEPSVDMVVGMLGILKAGGAYVPLDPGYPTERLAFMLRDTQTFVVVTQQKLLGRIPGDFANVVCLDADWELIARSPSENPSNRVGATDLAYVMYTSGSTGQPKGVKIRHQGVTRLVLNTNYVRLDSTDRVAQISNISFDAATFEIWGALLNGGRLIRITSDVAISPKEFARELSESGITTIFLTSALFTHVVNEVPEAFQPLRTVIAGGEALDPNSVRAVLRNGPPGKLINGYGPTENTTFTCCHHIQKLADDATSVPIGQPILNTQVYILDSFLNPVPIGVPGELYAGGDGLADGYWNRPELTSEKFISNPFIQRSTSNGRHSRLLYRTGDLARYLSNGEIEFLGRTDEQVKIRGFRIELGEIEAALRSHPAIRECAVAVFGQGASEKHLVAYFVASGEQKPSAVDLRAFIKKTLPDYMVPSKFMAIESLPLTPNGKLDRKALPDAGGVLNESSYQHPRDEIESRLAKIWEEVLQTNPIGIRDKFFELGGHSLLAVRLVSRIEEEFSRKLRVAAIFQTPTIEELAEVIRDEGKDAQPKSSLVEIQTRGERPPLFLVHGAGGGMFWGYANLSRYLGPSQPIYGFRSRAMDGIQEFSSIEEMAAQYVADLRKACPDGPYHIGGYCFGGVVAYEMARQIVNCGQKVALLALLNCAPPNSRYTRIALTPLWCFRFLKNLLYWAGYFRKLTSSQRREFARWKWHRLKQRFRGNSPERNGHVDVGDLVDLSSFSEEERKVWEDHIRALLKFRPQPYNGKVHLFRSPGHQILCSFDPDYGWGELAKGGVETVIVSGAHEKILEEPCVLAVATALENLLSPRKQAKNVGIRIPQDSEGGPSLNTEQTPEDALAFWKKQLAGAPALLEIPTDKSRPASQSGETGIEEREVSRLYVGREAEDRFNTALAAVLVLLRRYTNQDDLLIASSANEARIADIPVLRVNMSDNPTADELLVRIRKLRGDASEHARLPFSKLVQELCPDRDSSYQALCQVAFSYGANEGINPPDTKFDLHFTFEDASQVALKIQYARDLFETESIRRLLAQWETVLRDIIEHPNRRVSELNILPLEEQRRLLVEWNNTRREYPREKTLFQLFEEQVCRTPDAEALVCGDTRLTYRQLLARADAVADKLQELGVRRESLVGICVERSWEMVAGILGTLKAGGAYVPMDPAYPRERVAFMLSDAKAAVLLTQRKQLDLLPNSNAQVICLDEFEWEGSCGEKLERSESGAQNDSHQSPLAYVIYTSGSTGMPKGVAIENRNAVAFVNWAKEVFTAEELSGVLASTSICFDLSVFEMFVPLCCGGKVILAENALALPSLPAANEVKLINTVPSAIRELLRIKGVPASVQVVNLAGEPLATSVVNDIYRQTAVRKVYDLYGPTETTTYSTFTLRGPDEPPSIGRPLSNEQVYLLDANMQPVPIGVPGDLYIGGDGVAREYLNRPELTGEKFISNPFVCNSLGNGAANRLYKTGDLARWRSDGRLEFLGRRDHQVKIRGFRIELGEIESVLKKQAGVREAVVLAREDQPGIQRLVAYVAAGVSPNDSTDAEKLREALKAGLPAYMLPSAFVFLEALPLTPNGKVDRKSLPAPPEDRSGLSEDFLPPSSPVEEQLATIWREVLHLKEIGIRDNFFDLGGNSLLAIQIISRIRESFDLDLPISELFDAPTISGVAEKLASHKARPEYEKLPALTRISRDGRLPASFVQERLWFLDQIRPDNHAYNVPIAFRLKGLVNVDAFQLAFDQIIARHESLRTSFYFEDADLCQIILPPMSIKIPVMEVSDESSAQQLVNVEAQRPFDLVRGRLLRAKLLRLGEAEHIFVLVMHHIISDGWSLGIFLRELEMAYRGIIGEVPESAPPPLPVQYADYAAWRRRSIQGASLESELSFWKNKLAGAPPRIAFAGDDSVSITANGKAGHVSMQFAAPLAKRILKFGRHDGMTPFIVLMTGLAITLRKWTGQKDMVIGTVVAGRNRRELENVIGCFMNFLPLRIPIEGSETGREILAAVRTAAMEAQSHQDCPFEKIVEAVNPERKLNQNPLYNVAVLFQNFALDFFAGGPLRATPFPAYLDAALLDLRFEAEQTAQGLSLLCEYDAGLFERATIEQLIASCEQVLKTLVQTSDTPFKDFPGLVATTEPTRSAQPVQAQTIAIAGTFTVEPILEPLRYWMEQLEIPAAIEFAPYNQAFQQLLDPNSMFARNQRGLNVIVLRLEDWAGSSDAASADHFENINRNLREFVAAMTQASQRSAVPHLVCICPVSGQPWITDHACKLEELLATQLDSLAGIHVLASSELARLYPVVTFYDPSGDELGHIPYTPQFFTALATAIARKFHALNRSAYKVIVLDLDQTLWSGVCGEDGPRGICVDDTRLALQKFLLAQQNAGRLLCICSKNNEEDVWEVFNQRSDMLLRREHFAAWRVNWSPKSENLKALAKELQLGLDSFIFIDDNPIECAEVEANCPEVLTLQLPDDPNLIPQFLQHCWAFDHLKLTLEDRNRAEMYHQNEQRERFRLGSPNLTDFLAGLGLKVKIESLTDEQLARVAQLTQRTNQFNCTTIRRTEAEIQRLRNDAEILAVSVSDRFGDYGLTGVIIIETKGNSLDVETFLLSCRVLGRGIEHRVLARLGEIARERQLKWVDVHFNTSTKNKPVYDFLRGVGEQFQQASNGGYIFRFPAGFASAVVFRPGSNGFESASLVQQRSALERTRNTQHGARITHHAKFSLCREIALEFSDAAKIHARIESRNVVRHRNGSDYSAPRSELEKGLCEMWQKLLHVDRIGITDNFFEIGGHSLLAVRLFAEIHRAFGNKLPLVTIFQSPTIELLARSLSPGNAELSRSLLVPLQPNGSRPPLFLVHGAGGDILWGYANLSAHMPNDQPIYGIKSSGQAGREEFTRIEKMADCYVKELRAFQPVGPYYLGGYCFGGNVAYEMARQLRAAGQEVAFVALLDSAPANAGYERIRWWAPKYGLRFIRNLYYWLEDFAGQSPKERREFVTRKFRVFARKIGQRKDLRTVDLESVIDTSHFPEDELRLWQIHLEALMNHIQQPYPGEVLLLRTRGQPLLCSLEDDFGWGKLAQGGVRATVIPGSHENIFMEPNVRTLAEELGLALAQAQKEKP